MFPAQAAFDAELPCGDGAAQLTGDICEAGQIPQQPGAGTVAIDQRRWTARIQIDTGYPRAVQQHGGIPQQGDRIAAGQLGQDGNSCFIFIDAAQVVLCQCTGGGSAPEIGRHECIREGVNSLQRAHESQVCHILHGGQE